MEKIITNIAVKITLHIKLRMYADPNFINISFEGGSKILSARNFELEIRSIVQTSTFFTCSKMHHGEDKV